MMSDYSDTKEFLEKFGEAVKKRMALKRKSRFVSNSSSASSSKRARTLSPYRKQSVVIQNKRRSRTQSRGRVKGQRSAKYRMRRFAKRAKKYPLWFKTMMQQEPIGVVAGVRGAQLGTSTAFTMQVVTFWKHLAIPDIDNTIENYAGITTANQTTAVNANKQWLFDLTRNHSFRASGTNTDAMISFYELQARRDIPQQAVFGATYNGNIKNFGPPCDYNYSSCARGNPDGWSQVFADAIEGKGGTKVLSTNVSLTPYMSPALTSLFKIKRLYATWPDGSRSSNGVLRSGENVNLSFSRRKPYLCRLSKFGLASDALVSADLGQRNVGEAYQVLKETPLIMAMIHGQVTHDSTEATQVGIGWSFVDYVEEFKYKMVGGPVRTFITDNPVQGTPTISAPVQVADVTAAEAKQGQSV